MKSEDQSPLFIQLQLDGQEQHTDNVPNNSAPKWLKDFRFNVESERSTIGVSLNSSNPRVGTLGSATIPVKRVVEVGTQVQWFKLESAGEVCLVLRYSAKPGGASTPPGGNTPARAPSPGPGRTPGTAPRTETRKPASPTPAQATPAEKPPKTAEKPSKTAAEKPRRSEKSRSEGRRDAKSESRKSESKSVNRPKRTEPKENGEAVPVPWPLLVTGAVAAFGAALIQARRPKYYEVQEGDTLCNIGACFNRTTDDLYEANALVIADPNLIYPGDRIRIR